MKKVILLLLLITGLFSVSACTGLPEEEKVVHFSVDEGKQIVVKFLTAFVKGDQEAAQKNLTENAKSTYAKLSADFKGAGFIILEANELESGAEYHGKIFEGGDSPYYAINDAVITMDKTEQGDYVITNIVLKKELVIKQKDNTLIADENGTETQLLSLNDVPSNASPKDKPDKTVAVDKKAFGPVALSPDKRILLFAVSGANGFLGSYNLDSRETTALDVFLQSKINRINWSPDGNLYAVEKLNELGNNQIVMYDAMGNVSPFPGGDLFKDPQFTITRPLFLDNSFYFNIEAHKNKTLSGWWVYNLSNGKIGKLLK